MVEPRRPRPKTAPKNMVLSEGVATLLFQLRAIGVENVALEHQFSTERKWRFDMAFPDHMLAVEVDGGAWIGGRHTSGAGFEKDCEKLSSAAALGWRVMRFTPRMIRDGLALTLLEQGLAHD